MMTKKTMTIVSVFMVVALTAVGFAAWLITGTIDYKAEGSFVANELDDKYFKVEVEFDPTLQDTDTTKGNVVFGRPVTEDVAANQSWLSYSVNDEEQKLKVVATVKFIPDAGFSKKDGDKREMDYYLYQEIESKSGDDVVITKQYRTVLVKIDINELLDSQGNPDPSSKQFKWFDMAVQLGYIQYPTAHLIQKDINGSVKDYEDSKQLTWGMLDANSDVVALENIGVGQNNEFARFEKGFLYVELTYEDFEIQYATNAETATEAIAKIEINFNWGEALKVGTDYLNPYEFFLKDTHKPEEEVPVAKYLVVTGETYDLADTSDCEDNPETEEDEDTNHDNDNKIRYKDLAQRMLDYIRDYLNYTPADAENAASGLQFSFELLEGEPKPKNAN